MKTEVKGCPQSKAVYNVCEVCPWQCPVGSYIPVSESLCQVVKEWPIANSVLIMSPSQDASGSSFPTFNFP